MVSVRANLTLRQCCPWDSEHHHISGLAVDQRPDRGVAFPHDEVAFPVTGNGTVLDLGWALRDHDHIADGPLG